jgi:hypothetical protein
MQQLWRQAVRCAWGYRCARCGSTDIECHHIVKRKRGTLRHDWRNGIALCPECHRWADTAEGRGWVASQVDMDYLRRWDTNIKQVLTESGMSRREWDAAVVRELKRKIGECYG